MDSIFAGMNGNYSVTIFSDGTKIRMTPSIEFIPEYPESIDLKITNRCNMNCPYCHEQSTQIGNHGDLNRVVDKLDVLPPGVEIAIGGGNPLEHPGLIIFLQWCKKKGFITNLTVHANHVKDIPKQIFDDCLIYGLGISYNGEKENLTKKYFGVEYLNTVSHLIIGIHSLDDIRNALTLYGKVLLLGFKNQGRARINKLNNRKHLLKIQQQLWGIVIKNTGIISFDNLALTQLNIKKYLSPIEWQKFYMGDDGKFTMYYDAVLGLYGVSSTQPKQNMIGDNSCGIIDFFQQISINKREETANAY